MKLNKKHYYIIGIIIIVAIAIWLFARNKKNKDLAESKNIAPIVTKQIIKPIATDPQRINLIKLIIGYSKTLGRDWKILFYDVPFEQAENTLSPLSNYELSKLKELMINMMNKMQADLNPNKPFALVEYNDQDKQLLSSILQKIGLPSNL